jgi:hypothetical protein
MTFALAGSDLVDRAWGAVRVMVTAETEHGTHVTRPLYEALATRIHLDDRPQEQTLYVDALTEVGPPYLIRLGS